MQPPNRQPSGRGGPIPSSQLPPAGEPYRSDEEFLPTTQPTEKFKEDLQGLCHNESALLDDIRDFEEEVEGPAGEHVNLLATFLEEAVPGLVTRVLVEGGQGMGEGVAAATPGDGWNTLFVTDDPKSKLSLLQGRVNEEKGPYSLWPPNKVTVVSPQECDTPMSEKGIHPYKAMELFSKTLDLVRPNRLRLKVSNATTIKQFLCDILQHPSAQNPPATGGGTAEIEPSDGTMMVAPFMFAFGDQYQHMMFLYWVKGTNEYCVFGPDPDSPYEKKIREDIEAEASAQFGSDPVPGLWKYKLMPFLTNARFVKGCGICCVNAFWLLCVMLKEEDEGTNFPIDNTHLQLFTPEEYQMGVLPSDIWPRIEDATQKRGLAQAKAAALDQWERDQRSKSVVSSSPEPSDTGKETKEAPLCEWWPPVEETLCGRAGPTETSSKKCPFCEASVPNLRVAQRVHLRRHEAVIARRKIAYEAYLRERQTTKSADLPVVFCPGCHSPFSQLLWSLHQCDGESYFAVPDLETLASKYHQDAGHEVTQRIGHPASLSDSAPALSAGLRGLRASLHCVKKCLLAVLLLTVASITCLSTLHLSGSEMISPEDLKLSEPVAHNNHKHVDLQTDSTLIARGYSMMAGRDPVSEVRHAVNKTEASLSDGTVKYFMRGDRDNVIDSTCGLTREIVRMPELDRFFENYTTLVAELERKDGAGVSQQVSWEYPLITGYCIPTPIVVPFCIDAGLVGGLHLTLQSLSASDIPAYVTMGGMQCVIYVQLCWRCLWWSGSTTIFTFRFPLWDNMSIQPFTTPMLIKSRSLKLYVAPRQFLLRVDGECRSSDLLHLAPSRPLLPRGRSPSSSEGIFARTSTGANNALTASHLEDVRPSTDDFELMMIKLRLRIRVFIVRIHLSQLLSRPVNSSLNIINPTELLVASLSSSVNVMKDDLADMEDELTVALLESSLLMIEPVLKTFSAQQCPRPSQLEVLDIANDLLELVPMLSIPAPTYTPTFTSMPSMTMPPMRSIPPILPKPNFTIFMSQTGIRVDAAIAFMIQIDNPSDLASRSNAISDAFTWLRRELTEELLEVQVRVDNVDISYCYDSSKRLGAGNTACAHVVAWLIPILPMFCSTLTLLAVCGLALRWLIKQLGASDQVDPSDGWTATHVLAALAGLQSAIVVGGTFVPWLIPILFSALCNSLLAHTTSSLFWWTFERLVPTTADFTKSKVSFCLLLSVSMISGFVSEPRLTPIFDLGVFSKLLLVLCWSVWCWILIRHMAKPRFTVQPDLLGTGGYGNVYRATESWSRTTVVAAKVSHSTPRAKAVLIREYAMMQSLSHPNIARVLYLEEGQDRATMYMELLPNSLSQCVNLHGPLAESWIRDLLYDTLKALSHLHSSERMLHRDIKPSNILLDTNYCLKLSDFGTVKTLPKHSTSTTSSIVGTLPYRAPEVVSQGKYSEGSDLWALACCVIEIATGSLPWAELAIPREGLSEFIKTTSSHPRIPDHLSPELEGILKKMLSFDRQDRGTAADYLCDPYFAIQGPRKRQEKHYERQLLADVEEHYVPETDSSAQEDPGIDSPK